MEKFDYKEHMRELYNLRDELRKMARLLYGFGMYDIYDELDESIFHLSRVIENHKEHKQFFSLLGVSEEDMEESERM